MVAPYLPEVDQYIKSCKPQRNFFEPTNSNKKGTKLEGLKQLIYSGKDIVTTHALFKLLDSEAIELLQLLNYQLIIDETIEAISIVDKKEDDFITGIGK